MNTGFSDDSLSSYQQEIGSQVDQEEDNQTPQRRHDRQTKETSQAVCSTGCWQEQSLF